MGEGLRPSLLLDPSVPLPDKKEVSNPDAMHENVLIELVLASVPAKGYEEATWDEDSHAGGPKGHTWDEGTHVVGGSNTE